MYKLIVKDKRCLQVSSDRQTKQRRELLARPDRYVIQLLRRAMHLDVCGLQIRIQRNRTVSSACQRPELSR